MPRSKKPSAYSLALQQVQSGQIEKDELTSEQPDVSTAGQPDSQTVEQVASKAAKHLASQTARQPRIKATFYLRPDDIIAIDTMQTNQFRQSGKKPEKSEVVSEAIQLLFRQQNV